MAYSIRGEGSENVTLQNIMFGENAKTALFGDTDDLFSKDFTFRNNTMYHSTHRVPNTSAQNVDVYNNVVYDWVNRLTVIKNGTAINHFNNYYYKGTRTNLGSSWNGAPENFTWEVNGITTNATDPVTIYSKNNVIQDLYVYDDNDADISNEFQDDRYIWMHHAGQLVDGTEIIPDRQQRNKADDSYFVENPMTYVGRVPSTFLTAEQAKTAVPNDSGAYKYLKDDGTVGKFRDALDTEYHSNIINDNATDFAYDGGVNDPINSTLFTNFVASISTTPINSRSASFYDTNDYIPQAYLDANGITGNATIHNEVQPSGYTLLEEYMNQVDEAEQLAFPTAMGAGAYTSGARGQDVYHVTNLNATGSGSFRDAISQSNRTIVFDVSGIIEMIPEFEGHDILIEADNLTIAGQTAPEGNITITGARLVFRGSNVIVRYLKFRATDNVEGAINSANKSDVIFDHLSVSSVETNQVAIGMTNNPGIPAYNRTTQNSLIAYCGLGMIIGDTTPPNDTDNETYSLINNAFVFTGHRIPAKIAGAVHMDIINNLSHGHSARLIRIDDWSYNLNHVGNYYQMGRPIQQMHTAYYGTRNGLIYENDNYYDPNFPGDEWERFLGDEAPLPPSKFVQSPFAYQNSETLNILSSGDLKTQILPYVGCYKYINDSGQVVENRDSVDLQAIDDLINDVTRGSVSEFVDITISDIPTSNNTRPGNFYGTNQHIPSVWLTANGYADTTAIHNQVESDGYTVLEHYINQVDSSDTPAPPDPVEPIVSSSAVILNLIRRGIL
jgi:hypothetical protein